MDVAISVASKSIEPLLVGNKDDQIGFRHHSDVRERAKKLASRMFSERDSNLRHRGKLRPTRQKRRIGRTEGRALSKSDKKIIHEAGTPTLAFKSRAFLFFDLHLRENKAAATECTPLGARGGATAIKPPIPEGEYKDVGQPKLCPRSK